MPTLVDLTCSFKSFVIFNGVRFLRKFQIYKEQEYSILYASTLISSVRVLINS